MSPLHIRAEAQDISPFVLLPGDPGRAEWIAETFLQDVKCYNRYRSLLGFTGTYQGMKVSVQTTGMGCPSTAIVAEELISIGARYLVRVGTCGATEQSLNPGDLLIVQGAVPYDGTSRQYLQGRPYAPIPDWQVLHSLVEAADKLALDPKVGLIATEDAFYASTPETAKEMSNWGIWAIEMEASALFTIAKRHKVKAGCALAVSNRIGDSEFVAPEILAKGVEAMTRVGLEAFLLMH